MTIFLIFLLEHQVSEDLNINLLLQRVILQNLQIYGRLLSACTHIFIKIFLFMGNLNLKLI